MFQIPPVFLSNIENKEIPKTLKTDYQTPFLWVPSENEDYPETRNKDIEEIKRLKEENSILNKKATNCFQERRFEQQEATVVMSSQKH